MFVSHRILARWTPYLVASCMIVVSLGMQTVAVLKGACSLKATFPKAALFCEAPSPWPFMHYAMYSKAWHDGDVLHRYRIIGILANSQEVPIVAKDLGLNYWLYNDFIETVRSSDNEQLQYYVAAYNNRHQVSVVALRLESDPLVLSAGQMIPRQAEVIKTVPITNVEAAR